MTEMFGWEEDVEAPWSAPPILHHSFFPGTPFSKVISGFVFGDAMLFYCVTWAPWLDA
jgi:hypothetical protein